MGSTKGGGGSAPSTNASQVAGQQLGANVNTAIANAWLNNTNQVTPYGTLTYTEAGRHPIADGVVAPQFTAETKLNPAGQKLQDTTMAITQGTADLAKDYVGRIGAATAQPFSYDGMPGAPQYDEGYRRQQIDAITQRAQPQMDRDRAALEQRLADQGIGISDPAYRTAMDQYQRGVNDFRLGADIQGGNSAAQQYGLEANTRDRAINEALQARNQPINEVSALLGTGTGVQQPNFVNTPQTQVAPVDVVGAYNMEAQQRLAQQQMAQSGSNAMMGGLFGLGGSILGGLAGGPMGASLGGWLGRQVK